MRSWPISSDRLRAMYAHGRADATARRLARIWAALFGLGLVPRRWVTLEVTGRYSGRTTHFPVSPDAGVSGFEAIAARYPVFLVTPDRPRDRHAADGRDLAQTAR